MKKTLLKDFFREIWKTKGRFLSILAIAALGAGFYGGIHVTTTDMTLTAQQYYRNYHLMDYHLVSTYGITDDDITALEKEREALGVDIVMPAHSKDVIANHGTEEEATIKILAYSGEDQPLNQYKLLEGRMPRAPNECVVDTSNKMPSNFSVGKTITVSSGVADEDIKDSLSVTTFKVVGVVQTPLYVNFSRGYTTIGTGTLTAFIVVPEEAFSMDVYTDLYLTLQGAKDLNPFTDEYPDLVESRREKLEAFWKKRVQSRYDEIVGDAEKELNKGKKKLQDAEEKQKTELEKARRELDDARQQLADGRQELESQRSTFETEKASGLSQLQDAQSQLNQGEATLSEQEAEYRKGKAEFDNAYPDAVKKIEDGEAELNAKKAETESQMQNAEEQLSSAKQQLDEAKAQLAAGQKELDSSKAQLDAGQAALAEQEEQLKAAQAEIDAGQAQIDSGEAQLQEAQAALDAQKSQLEALKDQLPPEQYQAMMAQIEEEQAKINAGAETLDAQKAQLETAKAQAEAGQQQLDAAKAELEAGLARWEAGQAELDKNQTAYESGLKEYESNYQQFIDGKETAESEFAKAETELQDAKDTLNETKSQLDEAAGKLSDARSELENGKSELDRQWANYDSQIADAEQQIADAEQKLQDGEKELADGEKEYQEGKEESDKKIADARKEIADGEKELQELEKPEWYVWTRDDNVGYPDYANDTERIYNVSKVLPVFFILIAVLVCLTTMTRMVEERRTQIGILKALGYGKGSIMAKYIAYAALATLIGCAIGLAGGFVLFPSVLFLAYSTAYNIPDNVMPFHWNVAGIITGIGLVSMTLATLLACYKEMYAEPATLMRPKAPPSGKKILLERWKWLWSHIRFVHKLTLRNIFRYKKRALMTIVGIGGCTALMLTGFGLQYAITSIVDRQFESIMVYDAVISLKDNISDKEREKTFRYIENIDGVESSMAIKMSSVTVKQGDAKRDANLFVPGNLSQVDQYFHLQDRVSQTPIQLDDTGVILNEKLGRTCGVGAGDTVEIVLENKTVTAKVLGIHENYVLDYVFMTPKLYQTLFGSPPVYNCAMINTSGPQVQNRISTKLTENDLIMGSTFNQDIGDNFRDMIKNLNSVVIVIIISAGALAFIVLYNLVNINVAERTRELATIKVLGFRDGETSAYIYRENIVCSVIGILLGLVGGVFLESFVIRTAEVDAAMFSPDIPFYCFIFAGILTLLFTLVVNVAVHFKLKKLDMVESLKSIE